MRSRICLTLAWLVLLGALAVGNPWLPASPATAGAPALVPSEAARGFTPDGGLPQTAAPHAAAADAAEAGGSEPDEPVSPAASEAAEPIVESPPSTGN
jgi:hypothetical protein